jgi:hypothetical protein
LFNYGVFTVVHDHALLVFEQALRARFLEHHSGTITFVDRRTGTRDQIAVTTYEDVTAAVRR